MTPSAEDEFLIEREGEIGRFRAVLDATLGGDGRLVLVVGEPGIGKTALLGALRRAATDDGVAVLSARGVKLERDFAFGVTRQLYERVLDRASLLDGAAHLAAPALGAQDAGGSAATGWSQDATFATNHGLYWLTANLAERSALLLVVDDAHWADPPTLLFLNYLGRRLEGLPVVVALGLRSGEAGAAQDLLESLRDLPAAELLEPSALSEDASGAVIERLLGAAPEPAFRLACHEVTGGNPFLLSELVHALAADGVAPSDAAAARVRRLAPDTIARSVLSRLGAMSRGAMALSRAVAVLDTDAELRHVAALTDLDLDEAQGVADELAAAHILAADRPLRFAHPIMRQGVYDDLPMGRRAGLHARAARMLDAGGGDPDRAAVHLLATEPAADPSVLERLRAAATRALARGAPEAAVTLLRRAVAEPPLPDLSASVLLELGRAERLAGRSEAFHHLRQAHEAASEPRLRAAAARELATGLAIGARVEEASAVLEQAIADTPDRETALLLEAQLFGLSQASDALAARVAARLERVCQGLSGNTPGERLALAANVFHRSFLGLGSADEVAALARLALGDGWLMAEATGDHFAFYGPLIALRDSDQHDEVRPLLESAAADAHQRGSPFAVAATLATLARLEQLQGNLATAEAAATTALDAAASSVHYRLILLLAASSLLPALVEQGRLSAAEEVLDEIAMTTGLPPPTTTGNNFLAARAKLRLAQGLVAEAVEDTGVWLERQRLRGGLNAVGASSILHPALPFLATGDHVMAGTLADEMLAVAKRWGVAGHTGSCLTVLGLVSGGREGLNHLREPWPCSS